MLWFSSSSSEAWKKEVGIWESRQGSIIILIGFWGIFPRQTLLPSDPKLQVQLSKPSTRVKPFPTFPPRLQWFRSSAPADSTIHLQKLWNCRRLQTQIPTQF